MDVLVTGANRGIGAALMAEFRARGVQATGTARAPARGSALIPLDVTDAASVSAMGAAFAGRPLSLLVCNAGVYLDKAAAVRPLPELWAQSFAVNVTGVFLTVEALLPSLRAARGKIAIISSAMGSDARAPGGSYIYRASKAAVLNLGRNLASDLKAEGIAVGIYHPGWVRTTMGGPSAELEADVAARGLVERFDALDIASTGVFEDWQGTPIPF